MGSDSRLWPIGGDLWRVPELGAPSLPGGTAPDPKLGRSNGDKRTSVEVVASAMRILDPPRNNGTGAASDHRQEVAADLDTPF
jgi:hypothetical protein